MKNRSQAQQLRRAREALGLPKPAHVGIRRAAQRNDLAADGRQAIELIALGHTISSVLAIVGGSRARLYRAMAAVNPIDDPLLL